MEPLEKIDTPYGRFLSFRDDLITRQLREFGAHQRNELAMLLDLTRAGDVVLDVGAHIGTFAIPLARRVTDTGRVHAFEPDPTNYSVLEKNVALNGLRNVEAVRALVGTTPGVYERRSPPGNRGGTSFHLDPSLPGSGDPIVSIDEWRATSGGTVSRVDVVKIDAEGMDLDVLKSCERTLRECRPVVYVEISPGGLSPRRQGPAAVESLLVGLGYHLFRNVGPRNSTSDDYTVARLPGIAFGGPSLFDLLAVHPDSPRYPHGARGRLFTVAWFARRAAKAALRRLRGPTAARRATRRTRRSSRGRRASARRARCSATLPSGPAGSASSL